MSELHPIRHCTAAALKPISPLAVVFSIRFIFSPKDMSYASAAAKNSQGGGAHASQEYLEGSHGITGSSQNEESPDVDSNKVNVVPAGTDLHHLETESHQEFEKAQAAAEEELKKLQQEASKAAEAAKREAHKAKKWAGEEGEKLTEDAKKAEKT